MAVRGRLAPSPTGALHLGNARSFLLAWLSARAVGGSVVLRMEDLDHPKVKPAAAAEALDDLRWLGLDWDEGPDLGGPHAPYVQSRRIPLYEEALQTLLDQGLVYPCVCSRKDVEAAQSAPHAGEDGPRYAGTCRGAFATFDEARGALSPDRVPAWRLRTPEGETEFHDRFRGLQRSSVADTTGDFVLARHPGGAGYQLAVVVDDAEMAITEVVRGDDLLETTHRQLWLYRALGLQAPSFMHVPLVVGPDGRRLAKRHGDTRIASLREAGVAAEQVVGLLAWWSGWAARGERLRPADLIARYDPARIPARPAVVTPAIKAWLGIP
jgi:glutamyl-tRNA synthetase